MQNRQHSPSPTLPPKPKLNHRCAAHREPFSCVEVEMRRGVVCEVLGISPLKKGTVPFFVDGYVWRGTAGRDAGTQRRSE
jgi:hypothetical protein